MTPSYWNPHMAIYKNLNCFSNKLYIKSPFTEIGVCLKLAVKHAVTLKHSF